MHRSIVVTTAYEELCCGWNAHLLYPDGFDTLTILRKKNQKIYIYIFVWLMQRRTRDSSRGSSRQKNSIYCTSSSVYFYLTIGRGF